MMDKVLTVARLRGTVTALHQQTRASVVERLTWATEIEAHDAALRARLAEVERERDEAMSSRNRAWTEKRDADDRAKVWEERAQEAHRRQEFYAARLAEVEVYRDANAEAATRALARIGGLTSERDTCRARLAEVERERDEARKMGDVWKVVGAARRKRSGLREVGK